MLAVATGADRHGTASVRATAWRGRDGKVQVDMIEIVHSLSNVVFCGTALGGADGGFWAEHGFLMLVIVAWVLALVSLFLFFWACERVPFLEECRKGGDGGVDDLADCCVCGEGTAHFVRVTMTYPPTRSRYFSDKLNVDFPMPMCTSCLKRERVRNMELVVAAFLFCEFVTFCGAPALISSMLPPGGLANALKCAVAGCAGCFVLAVVALWCQSRAERIVDLHPFGRKLHRHGLCLSPIHAPSRTIDEKTFDIPEYVRRAEKEYETN